MILIKSIQTTLVAGVTATVYVTVSSATNIEVSYNGSGILAETAVTDNYTFEFTPTESNGILSLYADEPVDVLGDELYVYAGWVVSSNINASPPNTFVYVDFFGDSHTMTNVLLPDTDIAKTYRLAFTTSGGSYSGNGLEYYLGGGLSGSVSSDGSHSVDINPEGIDDSIKFFASGNDFLGTLSDISLREVVAGELSGTIQVTSKLPNYHNLYNNGAGVIKFKEEKNGWTSLLTFTPELMFNVSNDLYSIKNGVPYIHDDESEKASYYGVDNESVIAFRVSGASGVVKVLEYLSVESNIKPDYIHVIASNPYDQATDLCPADLAYVEGTFWASFFMDKLSPNFDSGSQAVDFAEALLDGDEMRAKYFDIFFIFNNEEEFRMSSVSFGLMTSSGHRQK